jgi:hypothetical protein
MTIILFGFHKHALDQGGTQNNFSEEPLSIHPFFMGEQAENPCLEATVKKCQKLDPNMNKTPHSN